MVCRGFGVVGEGCSSSFDFLDDFVGGFGPGEGLGVVVVERYPMVDSVGQCVNTVEGSRAEAFGGELGKPALN